jgi:hypothetical protein
MLNSLLTYCMALCINYYSSNRFLLLFCVGQNEMEVYGVFCLVKGFQMCTDKMVKVTFVFHAMP